LRTISRQIAFKRFLYETDEQLPWTLCIYHRMFQKIPDRPPYEAKQIDLSNIQYPVSSIQNINLQYSFNNLQSTILSSVAQTPMSRTTTPLQNFQARSDRHLFFSVVIVLKRPRNQHPSGKLISPHPLCCRPFASNYHSFMV